MELADRAQWVEPISFQDRYAGPVWFRGRRLVHRVTTVSPPILRPDQPADAARDRWDSLERAGWVVVLALGCVVGIAVVGPLVRKGWPLLLDWVPGPHPSVRRTFFGLDGGLQPGLPFSLLLLGVQ